MSLGFIHDSQSIAHPSQLPERVVVVEILGVDFPRMPLRSEIERGKG